MTRYKYSYKVKEIKKFQVIESVTDTSQTRNNVEDTPYEEFFTKDDALEKASLKTETEKRRQEMHQ